jgi:hypothetical protein
MCVALFNQLLHSGTLGNLCAIHLNAITFGNTFWEYCHEKNSITVNCEGHVEYLRENMSRGGNIFKVKF